MAKTWAKELSMLTEKAYKIYQSILDCMLLRLSDIFLLYHSAILPYLTPEKWNAILYDIYKHFSSTLVTGSVKVTCDIPFKKNKIDNALVNICSTTLYSMTTVESPCHICLRWPSHSRLIRLVVQREDQNLSVIVEHPRTPSLSQYPAERQIASHLL